MPIAPTDIKYRYSDITHIQKFTKIGYVGISLQIL